MRILFVTQIVPYPPHGGVLQRGYNLLRELGRDHDVHLCAFVHPDELRSAADVDASRRELARFCRQVEYFDLWPKKSAAHKLAAFAAGALYPLPFSVLAQKNGALTRRVRELCAAGAVDVVHLDTIGLAPLRAHCGKVPVVLAHHNIESQLMARRAEHETGAFARWYVGSQAERLRRYERQQSPRFARNITVSPLDSAQLERIAPGARTLDVSNGVDVEYFRPLEIEHEPAVVYTGGMNMFANRDAVEWFLDAIWPRIRAAIPDVRFHAVGAHPSRRLLDAVAAGQGVDAPGFVNDVRPIVGRSAVYVVPLRVGGGTRLKMVDAMAQGKAIVATRVGAEGIQGDDGTHFLLRDDPQQFADAVIGLLHDAAARRRLGAAARQRAVDSYAWPKLASRLAEGYALAVQESRA
jgi:polysaccharide biosynthesis protein PslH